MVIGLDKFKTYFAGYEGQYAIIGGTACDLLFDEAGLNFRTTKDIDLVLCVEVIDAAFGERFAAFLNDGGYETRSRSDGRREFYRFQKPKDNTFPFMIELFSRTPDTLDIPDDSTYTRIPAEEDIVSLSAIILDETYFAAMQAAKKVIGGVTILDETLLIPFKARAFVDLTARAEAGETGKGTDIKKHRNDVFRLLQLLPGDANIDLSEPIQDDLRQFTNLVSKDDAFDPMSFNVQISRDDGITQLNKAYGLDQL